MHLDFSFGLFRIEGHGSATHERGMQLSAGRLGSLLAAEQVQDKEGPLFLSSQSQ